ncbi:MAG: DNA gyrase subunit A, partial [Mollicutes bacterium]|nr:DNA gyrase subunit A [Mollicutes bacterium]
TIVNRRPKLLGIIPILDAYIEHQKEVVTKKTQFDLNFALAKVHITEGLVKAISILDDVIKTIRESKNKADAIINLVKKYEFSEKQAEAIVMLQLYRLTNTDITLLMQELEDLKKVIELLQSILADPEKLNGVIKDDLRKIKKEYGVPRKTEIEEEVLEIKIDEREMISKENVIIVLTNEGYLKRVNLKSYSASNEDETGLKDGDYVINLIEANTLDTLLVYTSLGNYLYIPVHQIPEGRWKELGKHLSNIVTISPDDKVINSQLFNNQVYEQNILIVTKNGQVMRTTLKNLEVTRYSRAMKLMKLKDKDEVVSVFNESENLTLITNDGYYIRADKEEIPLVNIRASGVKGINLKDNYVVSALGLNNTDEFITIFTDKKTAKRVRVNELELTGRAKRGNTLLKKVKSVNYSIINATSFTNNLLVGLVFDDNIKFIKNTEIPIMDMASTGSVIDNKKFKYAFTKAQIEEAKAEKTEMKIEEKQPQEIKIKEMTIDDFLEDFKL